MSSEDSSSHLVYNPFAYPPNYELAKIHQNATMPGKPHANARTCPCCKEKQKSPFPNWWGRSIEKDFKSFGGGVVGYFWLLRLYSFSIVAMIVIFGAYLQYLVNYYCENEQDPKIKQEACAKLFGMWMITNNDLKNLIQSHQDELTLARFQTLRGVLFLILLFVNSLSLYVVKWFKVRYPDKMNSSNFSLLFKNLKNDKLEDLLAHLQRQFGNMDIKQAFIIKKIQPFYSSYQDKLQLYYQCKIESNQKKCNKLKNKLYQVDKFCSQNEEYFYNEGNRAILVFNNLEDKEKVLEKYRISYWKVIKMFFSNNYQEQFRTYCEPTPRSEEILWKNIGIVEKQGLKVKILSIVYFILILAFVFAFLYFFMEVIYVQQIQEPYKSILTNFILTFVVFVGLTFRGWMDKLSDMRYPNTFTTRSMFIVITTVIFHILFYLFIPTTFLRYHQSLRAAILSLISNQSINFIIVQITLAGFDLMYCCWNRRKRITENEDKPIGCQKILHEKMQYPRFPIQFKLIILFKMWSLITFFAFQVPIILFLIFIVLIYLYIKDKMNIYYHYRMQVIHNEVQFKFLRIYSNIFSIYLLITFLGTQNNMYEIVIAGAATVIAIFVQVFYFRKLTDREPSSKDSFVTLRLDELDHIDSYQAKYEKFLDEARSDTVDSQIKEYLSRNGYGTMKTQDSSIIQPIMH